MLKQKIGGGKNNTAGCVWVFAIVACTLSECKTNYASCHQQMLAAATPLAAALTCQVFNPFIHTVAPTCDNSQHSQQYLKHGK